MSQISLICGRIWQSSELCGLQMFRFWHSDHQLASCIPMNYDLLSMWPRNKLLVSPHGLQAYKK